MFFLMRSSTLSPVSYASLIFSASTAGTAAQPGSDMPIASVMQAMVFAVYNPWQLPHPGMAAFSSSASSSSLIFPAATLPTPSNTSVSEMSHPCRWPGSMFPPVITIAGMLHLTAAMSIPGTILSQVHMQTSPSNLCAWIISSTASATFSLEGSE